MLFVGQTLDLFEGVVVAAVEVEAAAVVVVVAKEVFVSLHFEPSLLSAAENTKFDFFKQKVHQRLNFKSRKKNKKKMMS
jgi:hypothetical protein